MNEPHLMCDPWELEQIRPHLEATRPAELFVELGGAYGGTLQWFAEALPAADLVTIDQPQHLPGNDGGESLRKAVAHQVAKGRYAAQIEGHTHHPSTQQQLKNAMWGRSIDVLLIDAGHSPRSVGADLEIYTAHLREGGLLIMHDVGRVIQSPMPNSQHNQVSCGGAFEWAAIGRRSITVQGKGANSWGLGLIWW